MATLPLGMAARLPAQAHLTQAQRDLKAAQQRSTAAHSDWAAGRQALEIKILRLRDGLEAFEGELEAIELDAPGAAERKRLTKDLNARKKAHLKLIEELEAAASPEQVEDRRLLEARNQAAADVRRIESRLAYFQRMVDARTPGKA